jgi:hypothetical protein
MKLTNTWKHFVIALIVGLLAGFIHWAILKLDPNAIIYLWWWFVVGAAIILFNVENNQNRRNPKYWKENWIDSMVDWTVGMIGFVMGLLPFWLKIWIL